jgi:hypothetical protein
VLELSRLLARFRLALTHRLSYARGAERIAPGLSPMWQPVPPAAGRWGKAIAPGTAASDHLVFLPTVIFPRAVVAEHHAQAFHPQRVAQRQRLSQRPL